MDDHCDLRLREGGLVRIRAAGPADLPRLVDFVLGLDETIRGRRYRRFRRIREPAALLAGLGSEVRAEPAEGVTLVAVATGGAVVGHAAYEKLDPSRASVWFAVATNFPERRIGAVLLRQLATLAPAHGITEFLPADAGDPAVAGALEDARLAVTIEHRGAATSVVYATRLVANGTACVTESGRPDPWLAW